MSMDQHKEDAAESDISDIHRDFLTLKTLFMTDVSEEQMEVYEL